MHQNIGFAHLVERRFKRFDQGGGQLPNKSDRISQQKRNVAQRDLPHRRVDGGEKFVFGKHVGFGHRPHERRFAHVGVAYQRHPHQPVAFFPAGYALAVDLVQLVFQKRDAVFHDPAVGLEFFFPRSAHPRAPFLAAQVGPHTGQAGIQILVLRQLDLHARLGRLGPHRENIQDEQAAVEHLDIAEFAFEVTHLGRRQIIVEDNRIDGVGQDKLLNLLQLAFAHKGAGIGPVEFLGKRFNRLHARRFGQESQFVQILFSLVGRLLLRDKGDQYGGFGLFMGVDQWMV